MPIYEYECTDCGRITEALQKFSDAPLRGCPYCKGRVHKLVSLSTFHLKGSGWYVTDYASKNAGTQSKTTSDEKGSTAKKKDDGGSKIESKS